MVNRGSTAAAQLRADCRYTIDKIQTRLYWLYAVSTFVISLQLSTVQTRLIFISSPVVQLLASVPSSASAEVFVWTPRHQEQIV